MKKKFRNLLENNKWLKKIPNILTICNSLCGFGAILYTLYVYDSPRTPDHVLAISAWIILFAMLFDVLDGFTARIFNAASMHGLQMDSLSDMVTFGVAPAVLVAVMAHSLRSMKHYQYLIVWGACAVYIGCAALRLANYNIHAMLEKKSGDKFKGLPTPGAAAGICSLIIAYSLKAGEGKQILSIMPLYAAFLGCLMVSKINYHHIGKWLISVRRNGRRMLVLLFVLIGLYFHTQFMIIILINAYILSGPVLFLASRFGLLKREAPIPIEIEN